MSHQQDLGYPYQVDQYNRDSNKAAEFANPYKAPTAATFTVLNPEILETAASIDRRGRSAKKHFPGIPQAINAREQDQRNQHLQFQQLNPVQGKTPHERATESNGTVQYSHAYKPHPTSNETPALETQTNPMMGLMQQEQNTPGDQVHVGSTADSASRCTYSVQESRRSQLGQNYQQISSASYNMTGQPVPFGWKCMGQQDFGMQGLSISEYPQDTATCLRPRTNNPESSGTGASARQPQPISFYPGSNAEDMNLLASASDAVAAFSQNHEVEPQMNMLGVYAHRQGSGCTGDTEPQGLDGPRFTRGIRVETSGDPANQLILGMTAIQPQFLDLSASSHASPHTRSNGDPYNLQAPFPVLGQASCSDDYTNPCGLGTPDVATETTNTNEELCDVFPDPINADPHCHPPQRQQQKRQAGSDEGLAMFSALLRQHLDMQRKNNSGITKIQNPSSQGNGDQVAVGFACNSDPEISINAPVDAAAATAKGPPFRYDAFPPTQQLENAACMERRNPLPMPQAAQGRNGFIAAGASPELREEWATSTTEHRGRSPAEQNNDGSSSDGSSHEQDLDCSDDSSRTRRPRQYKRTKEIETFPSKLHRMLSEVDGTDRDTIVAFAADGRGVEIFNQDALEEELLPVYFQHSNYASFRRQLSYYKFIKSKLRTGTAVYAHPSGNFLREYPELAKLIKSRPAGRRGRPQRNATGGIP